VKKDILVFGIFGGVLIALLRLVEYRFLIVRHATSLHAGIIALIFAAVGIWLGLRLRQARVEERIVVREVRVPADAPFTIDEDERARLGITPRELQILGLMAAGHSNREIAQQLFVSENTVKTHTGRVFDKLGARRRTQAVDIARSRRLLP